jgi:hypothetical protein
LIRVKPERGKLTRIKKTHTIFFIRRMPDSKPWGQAFFCLRLRKPDKPEPKTSPQRRKGHKEKP